MILEFIASIVPHVSNWIGIREQWSKRRRKDGVWSDAENGRLWNFEVECDAETIDEKAPGVDLNAQGVAKWVQLSERNLEKYLKDKICDVTTATGW